MSQEKFEDPDPLFSTNGLLVEYKTETEELEFSMAAQTSNRIAEMNANFPDMHQIATSIIVGTFLEQMCLLYAKDKTQADELFKKVCEKLLPVSKPLQEISSNHYKLLREQYRQQLIGLIHTTWYEMYDKPRQNIPALNASKAEEALLSCQANGEPIIISKYLTEFKEIKEISTGGFGTVFVARNIFEHRDYAVKKISMPLRFKSETLFHERIKEIKKEVDVLSSLNHPNIVRYYSSWLEHPCDPYDTSVEQTIERLTLGQSNFTSSSSTSTHRVRIKTLSSSEAEDSFSRVGVRVLDESGTSSVCFANDGVDDGGWKSSECQDTQSHYKSETSTSDMSEEEDSEGDLLEKTGDFLKQTVSQDTFKINQIVLYIQMHLCKSTLHSWLKNRPAIDMEELSEQERSKFYHENISIFKQLLSALGYIHRNKIIHRDISSKNIFLDDDTLLLGDFGLSAKSSDRESKPFSPPRNNEDGGVGDHKNGELTKGLGTPLYSAPEQRTSSNYNYKVDMYSAGVILLELFWPMETLHEKSDTAKMVRTRGEFPKLLMKNFPHVCQVIAKMLSEDPKARPSASDLLENEIFQVDRHSRSLCDGEVLLNELKAENARLRDENTRLKAENARLNTERTKLIAKGVKVEAILNETISADDIET